MVDIKAKLAKSAARKSRRTDNRQFQAEVAGKKVVGKVGGRKPKAKSRKWLVREADRVFSLHIRSLYPFSVFSGKPTEHCFHVVSRTKFSVRWDADNAVGSTAGENFEMEFNPHKFIVPLIDRNGLEWYEELVRRSNIIAKKSSADLRAIIQKYAVPLSGDR